MSLGMEGEEFAAGQLKRKGWKIIKRNAKIRTDEIDIVARTPEGVIVFVEVKTMKWYRPEGLRPEHQMTKKKLAKFRRAASLYAGHYKGMVNDGKGWRLDVIALTKIGNDFLINHYENV